MKSNSKELGVMHPGERGRITAIEGDDPVSIRLLEMGMLPGEEVEVLGVAPFGDPIAIRVGSTRLALRRRDAARIALAIAGADQSLPKVLTPAAATT